MEIIDRTKIEPIKLYPGDSLNIEFIIHQKGWFGFKKKKSVMRHEILAETPMTVEEGVLFKTKLDGKIGIGGMVIVT